MEKLLPCKHCGGEAEFVDGYLPMWYIRCTNNDCGIQTKLFRNKDEAIATWSRRPKPEPLTLEQLNKMEGLPYYHVSLDVNDNKWAIMSKYIAENPEDYGYGTSWLAYASKPEECDENTTDC